MKRQIFTAEHEAFRATVRTFLAKEVLPHYEQWEKDGIVSREAWLAAGRQGLLGLAVPEEYGGGGATDFRYSAVLAEEFTRAGAAGPAIGLHNDIIGPYLTTLGTEEQKRRWLPGFCSGETITAIAMTEPGAGSDLQGIRTAAEDRGDHWLLNGSKTFISNGILADLVIVVARTTPRAVRRGCPCWWSSAARKGSSAGGTSTRSVRSPRTPPNCSSTTYGSPRRTCSANSTAPSVI